MMLGAKEEPLGLNYHEQVDDDEGQGGGPRDDLP
jgi:hypothetical protein